MSFQLSDGIAVLERTPATFRALLAGLPDSWTATNEGPDTFSPFDNLEHWYEQLDERQARVTVVDGVAYEEPALRRAFGESYERYTRSAGRWLPRRPGGRPQ